MNSRNMKAMIATLGLLVLLGCRGGGAPVSVPPAAPVATVPVVQEKGATKVGWEAEWQRTLEAARREGRVEFYVGSSSIEAMKDAVKKVKDKYGIDLFLSTGRGVELEAKVLAERRGNLFIPDVMSTGLAVMYRLKARGIFEPMKPSLLLPEVRDESLWYGGKLPWSDSEQHIFNYNNSITLVITINTSQVQPGGIKSIFDLLDPKWKGKIVISDPTLGSGSGFTGFANLIFNKHVDADFFRKLLATNEPVVVRDLALMGGWLARGKYPIGLFTDSSSIGRAVEAGAPLRQITIKEGAYLGSSAASTALVNNAPHPNAGRIFINWLFSREGALHVQKWTGKQSARIDIPIDGVDPDELRQPGVKYFPKIDDNEEFVLKERDRYVELAREIFK